MDDSLKDVVNDEDVKEVEDEGSIKDNVEETAKDKGNWFVCLFVLGLKNLWIIINIIKPRKEKEIIIPKMNPFKNEGKGDLKPKIIAMIGIIKE